VARSNLPRRRCARTIEFVLALPAFTQLHEALAADYDGGRRGYGPQALVAMLVVKTIYSIPSWRATVRLVRDSTELQRACGFSSRLDVPSEDACYWFAARSAANRRALFDPVVAALLDAVRACCEGFGCDTAIDSTTIPAYANGQRHIRKGGLLRLRFSDPDASWGHRGAVNTRARGSHYCYRIHVIACTRWGLPIAWQTQTGIDQERPRVPELLATATSRIGPIDTCSMDTGYDAATTHSTCAAYGVKPLIALHRNSEHLSESLVPTCTHGRWVFAGADAARQASKWRCPGDATGACVPRSTWIRADRLHPLIPRSTSRYAVIFGRRVAIEGMFGTLKNHDNLNRHYVRRLDKVALHVDLCMIGRLAWAIARAQTADEAADDLAA
jgi:Transposase DDE domain/Transposase domain (DUF772)